MKLEFVPLLQVQRDLYRVPRGMERFRNYLATMVDPDTRDLKLPLVAMNPMAKDHVPAVLDQLLELEADAVAARAVTDAEPRLAHLSGEFKVALVVADDAGGGWTNRYSTEFQRRFRTKAYHKRGWLEGALWTSEPPSIKTVQDEVLTAVYRAAYIQQNGFAHTLNEMLAQDGFAMANAGCKPPSMEKDELDYTREVIAPHLHTNDQPTIMACLFGDEAASSLGYTPLGLSERAGLALALQNAHLG